MSMPPIRIGAPAFRPCTSANSAWKGTDELKSRRSSPIRKITAPEKTRPTRTNNPTLMLRARLLMVCPVCCKAFHSSRAEKGLDVLVLRRCAVDEIFDARILARAERVRGAAQDDLAAVHHGQPIRDREGAVHVVGDDDAGHREGRLEAVDQVV